MEIDDSPVSTSVIPREQLENRNIRQIDQALALIEGVNAIRTRGPNDNDFGLGLRGFSGRAGQYRTLILVDGQPVNNSYIGNVNWSIFAVSEMERIEVARGPFSSLYGGNAMGGVVNLITRPVNRRHIEVFAQYGNRETSNYSIHAADRFFDKLGASFGYTRYQSGGYPPQEVLRPLANTAVGGTPVTGPLRWLTPTGGVHYQVGMRGRNWFNQEAYRARAEYSFSPKVFASFQYMHQSRIDGYDAYTPLLRDAAGNPVDSGIVSFVEDGVTRRLTLAPSNFIGAPTGATNHIVQAQILAALLPTWSLRIAAGVNYNPSDWSVTPGPDATLRGGSGNYTTQLSRGVYGNVQLTQESRSRTLTLGMETRIDRASITGQTVPLYTSLDHGGPFTSQARGKSVNQAAYVQYQWPLVENLNLTAGGRWDYWRTYAGAAQRGLGQPLVEYPERSTNAFTGKVAAVYALPGNWKLRGSVGSSFRNPSVFELYRDTVVGSLTLFGNPNVKPEKLLAYEAGIRRPFRGGHSLEVTFFENRVKDLIYRVSDFEADPNGNTRRLTNAGLSRTRGAEIAMAQQVLSWLHLRESYTYTNNVITKNDPLPDTVGKRVPFVPLNTLTYLVTASRRRWTATWGGRYVGAVYSTDTNTDTVRGVPTSYSPFFEMDTTFSFQMTSHVTFVATADNLLNRRYYVFSITPGRSIFAGFRIRL